jgi:hypothetical protein
LAFEARLASLAYGARHPMRLQAQLVARRSMPFKGPKATFVDGVSISVPEQEV